MLIQVNDRSQRMAQHLFDDRRYAFWKDWMMTYAIDWLPRAIVSAVMASALALGSTTAKAAPRDLAQATPPPAPPAVSSPAPQPPPGGTAAAPSPRHPTDVAEARIADLRTKLQITAAEESQFTAVAEVMRANAQSMEALLVERSKDTDRTAVAALRWYERLTDAHAAALNKFVPAFEALYTVLSDSQRKTADAIFQRFAERPLPAKSR